MVTFTVEGLVENDVPVVFKYSDTKAGYTYGSKLTNGVAGRGRPSKFPSEKVTLSEPLPVVEPVAVAEVSETEKVEETQLVLGVPVPDADGNVSLD